MIHRRAIETQEAREMVLVLALGGTLAWTAWTSHWLALAMLLAGVLVYLHWARARHDPPPSARDDVLAPWHETVRFLAPAASIAAALVAHEASPDAWARALANASAAASMLALLATRRTTAERCATWWVRDDAPDTLRVHANERTCRATLDVVVDTARALATVRVEVEDWDGVGARGQAEPGRWRVRTRAQDAQWQQTERGNVAQSGPMSADDALGLIAHDARWTATRGDDAREVTVRFANDRARAHAHTTLARALGAPDFARPRLRDGWRPVDVAVCLSSATLSVLLAVSGKPVASALLGALTAALAVTVSSTTPNPAEGRARVADIVQVTAAAVAVLTGVTHATLAPAPAGAAEILMGASALWLWTCIAQPRLRARARRMIETTTAPPRHIAHDDAGVARLVLEHQALDATWRAALALREHPAPSWDDDSRVSLRQAHHATTRTERMKTRLDESTVIEWGLAWHGATHWIFTDGEAARHCVDKLTRRRVLEVTFLDEDGAAGATYRFRCTREDAHALRRCDATR